MKRQKFQKLCAAVAAGKNKFLENTRDHQTGKLITSTAEDAKIDIFGKKETWPREECKEFYLPETDYRIGASESALERRCGDPLGEEG